MIVALILLCLIESVVLSSLVYTDHSIWGGFSLLVAGAAYTVFFNGNALGQAWGWIVTHPINLLLYTVAYLLAGVIWSFFKYYSFVKGKKAEGVDKKYLVGSSNTGRVISWIAYWPISIILHVVGDGVYKMFRWIYTQVSEVYDNILEKVYAS